MGQNQLRKIVIEGDPHSKGVMYGREAKAEIEKCIGFYRMMFTDVSGLDWNRVLDFSKTFIKRLKEYDETIIDEINGVAEGSGRTFEEILTINVRTEILFGLQQERGGCTALCVLSEKTTHKNTILAQNWDWKAGTADHILLLQINRNDAPSILTFVEAGQFARFGMNSAGHGICNNYIQCEADGKNLDHGIPTTFIRRKALGQEKYYDVIGSIIHSPRSFSANYLVATAEGGGDSINIEATPETVYFLYPEDGILVHSNHMKGAGSGNVGIIRIGLEDSIYRDRRVEKKLREKRDHIVVDDVKEALRDHFGYPFAVCRHPIEAMPFYDQWRTNASLVMDLNSKTLWLAAGPPCETKYSRYTFND